MSLAVVSRQPLLLVLAAAGLSGVRPSILIGHIAAQHLPSGASAHATSDESRVHGNHDIFPVPDAGKGLCGMESVRAVEAQKVPVQTGLVPHRIMNLIN